ncbi:MAG: L-threonylcarbamoyladenylate synthase [Nanobdellota archaeon]
MHVITKDELKHQREHFKRRIISGEIFIHPTDTIYGLGCHAFDETCVNKIREIKNRPEDKPFSIIAPSKEWIREHCHVDEEGEEWLRKLPGPYTLILRLKEPALGGPVNSNGESIGIRIPDHWISQAVSEIGVPIVTTSANLRGQEFMTSIEDLPSELKSKVNFAIYEGEINGSPSTIVNLAKVDIEDFGFRKVI